MTEFLNSIVRDLPMAALLAWFLYMQLRESRRNRESLEKSQTTLQDFIMNHVVHNTEALERLTAALDALRDHCAQARRPEEPIAEGRTPA